MALSNTKKGSGKIPLIWKLIYLLFMFGISALIGVGYYFLCLDIFPIKPLLFLSHGISGLVGIILFIFILAILKNHKGGKS